VPFDEQNSGKLGLGIIGLGLAGSMMVPAAQRHARIELRGAAEPNLALRARFEECMKARAHESALDLIRREDIDAVYIATPHQLHREQAILAAEHGKHVIVEKPMALTLQDCDAMIETAAKHNIKLIVGHTHSFDPPMRLMHRYSVEKTLGDLAMLSMWNFTDFMYRPRRPEELDTKLGGGILFNQIPHQVDIARLVAASPVRSVRSWTGVLDPSRPTEGASTTFMEFRNGAVATMVYSGYDHFDSDELHGWVSSTGRRKEPTHGTMRRRLLELTDADDERRRRSELYGYHGLHPAQPEYQPHFGIIVASYLQGDLRATPEGIAEYGHNGKRDIKLESTYAGRDCVLDELCAAVLDLKPPAHDGEFARDTLEACLAIQKSAYEGREVVIASP